MIELKSGRWDVCILGAAAQAVGIQIDSEGSNGFVERILDEWPWLEANDESPLVEILTLFDQRVCRREMSLESLIQHIRQIEPPCSCGVRGCVCERIEGLLESVPELQEVAQ
jgi:hypothetical protein